MSHQIDYSKFDEPEKSSKAIDDIKFWLGPKKFAEFTTLLVNEAPLTLDAFRMTVSFCGVRGFPAEAWWNLVNSQRAEGERIEKQMAAALAADDTIADAEVNEDSALARCGRDEDEDWKVEPDFDAQAAYDDEWGTDNAGDPRIAAHEAFHRNEMDV